MNGPRRRAQLLAIHPWCVYCRCPLDELTATLEHIIPRSLGGGDNRDNVTLACRPCNQRRGNTPLDNPRQYHIPTPRQAMRALQAASQRCIFLPAYDPPASG